MSFIELVIAGFVLVTFFFAVMTARVESKERTFYMSMFVFFFALTAIMLLVQTGNGWLIKAIMVSPTGGPVAVLIVSISLVAIMFGIVIGASEEVPKRFCVVSHATQNRNDQHRWQDQGKKKSNAAG